MAGYEFKDLGVIILIAVLVLVVVHRVPKLKGWIEGGNPQADRTT